MVARIVARDRAPHRVAATVMARSSVVPMHWPCAAAAGEDDGEGFAVMSAAHRPLSSARGRKSLAIDDSVLSEELVIIEVGDERGDDAVGPSMRTYIPLRALCESQPAP